MPAALQVQLEQLRSLASCCLCAQTVLKEARQHRLTHLQQCQWQRCSSRPVPGH
jgi:hypothetical protein